MLVNDDPPAFAPTGIASAFRESGLREIARRSDKRQVMRLNASEGKDETARPAT